MFQYNTSEVETKYLGAHGEVIIKAFPNGIMVYEAQGPANIQLLQTFVSLDETALQEFSSKFDYWCEVIIMRRSCMILADAMELLQAHLIDTKQRHINAYATALVIPPEVEGAFMMESKYQEIYDNAGFVFEVFKEEAPAFDWAVNQRDYAQRNIGAKKA